MSEVFDVHQTDGSCGQKADDSGTKDCKDAASYLMILVLDNDVRDPYHYQKWQPNHRDGGKNTSEDAK